MRPNKNALSLHTSFHPPPPDHLPDAITITTTTARGSPTTTSTTSPSLSPSSSPLRRLYHSTSNRFSPGPRSDTTTSSTDDPTTPSRSHSPFRLSFSRSGLFRRSSLVLLRRRPSKVDMALSAERTRCDGDAIERQGLDLMEPRPVDPIAVPMDSMANSIFEPVGLGVGVGIGAGFGGDRSSTQSYQSGGSTASRLSQPRFVMGGIFEVMEGRA